MVLDRDRVHLLWHNICTLLGRQDGAADTKREEKQQECDACNEAHVILPAQPGAVNIENCKCRCRVHRASGAGQRNRR